MVSRRSQTIAICIVLMLSLAVLAGCGATKAVVKSVTPVEGMVSSGFKISGTSFGKTRDKSSVTVGGKKAGIASWSDTSVTATVPASLDAGSYPVVVVTGAGTSNKVTYKVLATFTGSSPLPAMLNYFKSKGESTTGMTFSVVATSTANPDWKLDKAVKTGTPATYFIFHKTADGWTILDVATSFTAERMKIDGAPSDLKPPAQ
jgi:uncharacterized protein (TIGR03437 family)